jgi:hypothetical protein
VALIDQRMRGRSTGIEVPFGKYAQVYTFRGGVVVHRKAYMSQSEALEAAGLSDLLSLRDLRRRVLERGVRASFNKANSAPSTRESRSARVRRQTARWVDPGAGRLTGVLSREHGQQTGWVAIGTSATVMVA